MFVLSTVPSDGLNSAVVEAYGEGESDDVVAGADQLEVVLGDAGFCCSAIEEVLYLFEEARLLVIRGSDREGADT